MKLTKEEEAIILARREKEEANKPKKEGFLKENLYTVEGIDSWIYNDWFFSEQEKQKEIENFTNSFNPALKAGTRFICYINSENEESWYDDEGYGIEAMDADWAEEYLRDIAPIKSEKKEKKSR